MKEKLVIPPEESADLSEEEKNYFRQKAQESTREEAELMDWQTGDPEKRKEILR